MKSIRRHHKKKLKEKRETLLLNLFLTFLFLIFIIDNLLKESQVINQIVRSTRGKVCSLNLSAYSTFMKKMQVEGIAVDMDGISYEFQESDTEQFPEILPNLVTDIGKLYFNPKEICKNSCYTSFDLLSKPFGVKWMSTVNNYSLYTLLDSEKLVSQLKAFIEVKQTFQSIAFRLTTSQIRRHEFNASINFVWPRLLAANVEFPFVQIDRAETKYIEIHNPSNQLLFVHFVLHDPKAHGTEIQILPEALRDCPTCILSEDSVFSFSTNSSEIYVSDIKPLGSLKIGVTFRAANPGTYSTILYMRNNLTVVEAVWVTARAVVPQFKFGNRRPGSQTSLMFEIGEKHLKLCDKSQTNVLITSKRSFTAKNYGEVPIMIEGINIESYPCEGYGFKVLNCAPLQLMPNESKKIEIAFSPDFTLARIVRQLNFVTSIGQPVNFTLLATVPPQALENCSKYIARPAWESDLKGKAVLVLTIALGFVLMAAYFDADKVLKDHTRHLIRDRNMATTPLDLRKIGLESSGGMQTGQESQVTANGKTNNVNSSPNLSGSHGKVKKNGQANGAVGRKVPANNNSNSGMSGLTGLGKRSWTDFKNRFTGTKPAITTQIVTEPAVKATVKSSAKQEKREASGNNHKEKYLKYDEDSASNSSKENESVGKSSNSSASKLDTQSPLTSAANNIKAGKGSAKKSKNQLNAVDAQKTPNNCSKVQNTMKSKEQKVKTPKIVNGLEGGKSGSPTVGLESVASFVAFGESSPVGEQCLKNETVQKKGGKTPGRERKAAQSNPNMKQNLNQKAMPKMNGAAMKPNAFQFNQFPGQFGKVNNIGNNGMLGNGAQSLASIWNGNRASFSDVVAQSPVEVPVKKPYFDHNQIGMIHSNSAGNVRRNLMAQEQDLKRFGSFGFEGDLRGMNNNLGPIGTRKSPSQTPVWEPLQNTMQRPTPIAPPATPDSYINPNYPSFAFSGNPLATRHEYESFEAFLRFYGPKLTQQQINDEIFAYGMQLEEKRKLQNGWNATNNVPTSSSSYWSPAYHASNNNVQNQTANYAALRPPPGLNVNSVSVAQAMLQQQQQQQQQAQQLNIPPPGFQPTTTTTEAPPMENGTSSNFGNLDPIWSFIWDNSLNNSGDPWSNSNQQQQ